MQYLHSAQRYIVLLKSIQIGYGIANSFNLSTESKFFLMQVYDLPVDRDSNERIHEPIFSYPIRNFDLEK